MAGDQILNERRGAPRIEDSNRIAIRVQLGAGETWAGPATYLHDTLDVSRNGLSFRTYERLPSNANLRIEVMLEDPPRCLSLSGKVRWVATVGDDDLYSVGVQLQDLISEDGQHWLDYVDSRLAG